MENQQNLPNLSIVSFCKGNNEAIADVYKQWVPQLYLIAYRYLKSQEEAEDVVADCFEKLLSMPTEKRHQKFITYGIDIKALMIVIVKNKSLDVLKTKNNRNRILDSVKNWIPTTVINLSKQHFTNEDFEMLISCLNEKEKKIVTLNTEGFSHQEISLQMNISEKTVSNTLSLSRNKLKELWHLFME